MLLNLKRLLSRGPEIIEAEKVFIREIPLQELGLTILFVVMASAWCIFVDEAFLRLMKLPANSPAAKAFEGLDFVLASGLVLYLVLRRTFRTRRLAEEARRLSQERFESVALAASDAIWDLNLETKVVWWSDGVHKLFGYSPDEVSSKLDWWVERLHPEDRERVLESMRKIGEQGRRTWRNQYRFRRKDGTYASVVGRGFLLADPTGTPVRAVGGISDVTEQERAEQALEKSHRQLRGLTARLQSVREDERTRVAREIHDELGQVLTALKINLDWLERKLGVRDNDPSLNPLLDRVVESAEIAETAITSVQKIAADLRPSALDDLGLTTALAQEARRFQARTGIPCEVSLPEDGLELPGEVAVAVFRIFQEALTNVARHAQASQVRATLRADADRVFLRVEDNGRGIEPGALANTKSLGLLGMRERATVLGGEVLIEPLPGGGTGVALQLPRTADETRFWAEL
jgi:two-component system sensor histidine kinase UhpB